MFEVIGITKIDKPSHIDRIWTACNSYEEKVAPILGSYQVTIKENINLLVFEAEIRNTPNNIPQIMYCEEFSEFLNSRKEAKTFEVLPNLILEHHFNLKIDFPIKVV